MSTSTGRTVLSTVPYGKHMLMRFDDGRTLHTHLRMEGSWAVARTGSPGARGRGPYIRAVLGNAVWTALGDRLGMLDVVDTRDEHTLVGHLGPDILDDAFPTDGLPEALRRFAVRGSTPIAEVLLDQTVVAGIGTIWTAEPLFLLRIWPWTPADQLADPGGLLLAIRKLMAALGRLDRPADGHGRGWPRDDELRAQPAGRPCRRCGTPIDRGTAFQAPEGPPDLLLPPVPGAGRRLDGGRAPRPWTVPAEGGPGPSPRGLGTVVPAAAPRAAGRRTPRRPGGRRGVVSVDVPTGRGRASVVSPSGRARRGPATSRVPAR